MSFGSILALLKGIVDLFTAIPKWIAEWRASRVRSDIEERQKKIDDGVKKAKEAKTIEEKANAACEIEKALNPDSHCDDDSRS